MYFIAPFQAHFMKKKFHSKNIQIKQYASYGIREIGLRKVLIIRKNSNFVKSTALNAF